MILLTDIDLLLLEEPLPDERVDWHNGMSEVLPWDYSFNP